MAPSQSSLLAWYANVRSRFIDLVGDFAGKEPFLIEGDSLLRECFSDPRLDFDPGFQLLHATYIVESFLQNLAKRGCNFYLVFIDEHQRNCVPESAHSPARYLLARRAIIEHLSHNAKEVSVQIFRSLNEPAFEEFLESSSIYFAACSDGSSVARNQSIKPSTAKGKEMIETKDSEPTSETDETDSEDESGSDDLEDESGSEEDVSESGPLLLPRAVIYWFLHKGLDVALLNGLEFRDSKVMSFVLERSAAKQMKKSESPINLAKFNGNTKLRQIATNTVSEQSLLDFEQFLDSAEARSVQEQLESLPKSSKHLQSSARLTITVLGLRFLMGTGQSTELFSPFLLHTAILATTPLSSRRLGNVALEGRGEELCGSFLDSFSLLSTSIFGRRLHKFGPFSQQDTADLLDGRLFRTTLLVANKTGYQSLPASIQELHSSLLEIVQSSMDKKLDTSNNTITGTRDTPEPETKTQHDSVLPFTHPSFDKHLSSIEIKVEDTNVKNSGRDKIFRELTHWHNAKKTLKPKAIVRVTLDARQKKRLDRSNQRYMAEMTAYAASLTNANGKVLSPEPIIVSSGKPVGNKKAAAHMETSNNSSKASSVDTKASTKSSKKSTSTKPSLNVKLAAELAKKDDARDRATFEAWTRFRAGLDEEKDLERRYIRANNYVKDVSERKNIGTIRPEIELYKLSTLNQIWSNFCRQSRRPDGWHVAAIMFDISQRLAITNSVCPTETADILKDVAKRCGMNLSPTSVSGNRSLSFPFAFQTTTDLSLGVKPNDFQLLQTGPYMDRDMDSAEDPRVSFRPDGWQRKVLDALDASDSLLVVAPTSSGKTFISFYAMEKVLRANDEDVVVYVAPTKALVNQIAAEVQARFSKIYKHAGQSLYAIHTRDYRINNPTQCQVLVTVPHILQIMLMSPSNKAWVPRVKSIIFDEVHSIGQAEDGIVWEQLLLMAPSQVICLSATVGNPKAFADWLASTRQSLGLKLEIVEHEHRFSDLRKYVYHPAKDHNFSGLSMKSSLSPLGLEDVPVFGVMHPATCLTKPKRGIPSDLALESRDCLLLYQAMDKFQTKEFSLPADLSPTSVLPFPQVKKSDVIAWSANLKAALAEWMQNSSSPFLQVLEELAKARQDEPLDQGHAQANGDKSAPTTARSHDLLSSTLQLLDQLHHVNALPAILFNYDRSECEKLGLGVLRQIVKAEDHWKATDPGWKSKVSAFNDWKKVQEAKKNSKGDAKGKSSAKKSEGQEADGGSKLDRSRDEAASTVNRFEGFDPAAPIDQFSFADVKKGDASELARIVDNLQWRGINQELIDAFQRGIGIHHAGMNRRYRQAVEVWFRRGFLRVVIATGTLSLGINMPCKTVVFSGDSVFLTALNFRQAGGRAGRRGFDILGNVVFHGISLEKANRLMSSRLPDLNGHFPITTSLVLRILSLLYDTKSAPYAVQSVNSLLSQPRLYLGGESYKHQVLHHVRFSIEYLRKQGLVGSNGEPLNFASCVSHLYFVENSAFAFHALLKDGYFHELSTQIFKNEKDTLLKLMLVMAHLFGRIPAREATIQQKEATKRSSSVVILPELPADALAIMKQHNNETLATYETYVRTFAEQHCKGEDTTLPFSHTPIGPTAASQAELGEVSKFLEPLPQPTSRSPFVALSGCGDDFDSISDLCSSVRDGIFLEKAVVPHLDVGEEQTTPLNAYLYDFYRHGGVKPLETANRIRRGDVWYLLNDFSLVLATIVASFENFLRPGDESEFDPTLIGGKGDVTEIEIDEKEVSLEDGDEDADADKATPGANGAKQSALPTRAAAPTKSKKKAAVADSWDDGESSESEQEEDDMDDVGTDQQQDEAEKKLKRVYFMLRRLKEEFDTKFKAIFA